MQSLIRAAFVAGAVLFAGCGVDEPQAPEPVGSSQESSSPEDTVRATTHTCTTYEKGSHVDPGAPCFNYVDAKNAAIAHCTSLTPPLSLGYHSWAITSGTTCPGGYVTYFRYGCCGDE